ncbi:hypothetical protein CMI47_21165, partial [Candidatus Pacearchaeota archaeon]|nr:hypothetical protein [Candidatus Pacearchaeota archaeon]
MKNKSTLAKLLAEEDIFVVHKQMDTAYFNTKSRELGLPIWKDELMTKDTYDLLIGHEVGHALWTPLDMLEEAQVRGLNHGFVNILEDARIEKKSKEKYPGLISVFTRGYANLMKRDFFGISKKPIGSFGLIDRINIFMKTGDKSIPFSETELPWVEKTAKTKTPADVLDLAEELYKFMEKNPETKGENFENLDDLISIPVPGMDGELGENPNNLSLPETGDETSETGETGDETSETGDETSETGETGDETSET